MQRKVRAWARFGRYERTRDYPAAKRMLDLCLLLISLPLWVPLAAIVALLVRFFIGRPVLFRQSRPGLRGRIFTLFKFRTMTEECDSGGRVLPDAKRLTRFGQWLRSTSLDELPELFNVLRGEMSLVGPRPLLVQYLPLYSTHQMRRHELPPGLTGWAQLQGRNALTWEEKFEADLWYVDHASIGLDLLILCRSILVVIRREGISAAGEATMPPFSGAATELPRPPVSVSKSQTDAETS